MDLLQLTIGQYLHRAAQRWPDSFAVTALGAKASLNWLQLDALVDDYAKGLLHLGLKKGDRLVLWCSNRMEWIISYLAAARLGIISVAANPSYQSREILCLLEISKANALLFTDGFRGTDHSAIVREIYQKTQKGCLPSLQSFLHVSDNPCEFAVRFADLPVLGAQVSVNVFQTTCEAVTCYDVTTLVFTSGSTCYPKGVMLTHFNLVNNASFTGQRLALHATDRLCLTVPLFHSFGMSAGLLQCMGQGVGMILIDYFRPEWVMQAIEKHRCTVLHGVPTMFMRLIHHEQRETYDLSCLRTGLVAGAACSERLLRDIVQVLGMLEVAVGYGQTETSPACTQTYPHDPLDMRIESVGTPLPHVEMQVRHRKTGVLCKPGKVGEFYTRGFHVMKGYFENSEQTSAILDADGWLRTGDCGYVDNNGYYHFTCRVTDIIICGGENISPREIERVIQEHESVQHAEVFGVKMECRGQDVAASVCLHPGHSLTKEDLVAYLTTRLARFKIPRHFEFVHSFPFLPNGKINTVALRSAMQRNIEALNPNLPQKTDHSEGILPSTQNLSKETA